MVFARAPVPGRAKTRLIPVLGRRGAAGLQEALLEDALHKIRDFPASRTLYLSGSKIPPQVIFATLELRRQRGRNLGERLENAFLELLEKHSGAVVVGTDSPLLSRPRLRLALNELKASDAVLGPCPDGGFYLIGLRRFSPGLLKGVRWGSRFAFADTRRRLLAAGLICSKLEPCGDIDRPRDFARIGALLCQHAQLRRLAPSLWNFCRAWFSAGARRSSSSQKRRQSSRRRELPRRGRKPLPGRA